MNQSDKKNNYRPIKTLEARRIRELLHRGHTRSQIAKELDRAVGTICCFVRRNKIAPQTYRRMHYSEELRIVDLFHQGISKSAIAREVKRPVRTIFHVLKRRGINLEPLPCNPLREDEEIRILELFKQGMPKTTIARELNRSFTAVQNLLKRKGYYPKHK